MAGAHARTVVHDVAARRLDGVTGAVLRDAGDDDGLVLALAVAGRRRVGGAVR